LRPVSFVNFRENIGPQLPVRRADHHDENHSLKEGTPNSGSPNNDIPPFGRRFLLMVLGVVGGLILASNAPDDDRVLLGAACIGGGCLLIAAGFGLWLLNGFPATWGWLL
jgi:hypothetical protein